MSTAQPLRPPESDVAGLPELFKFKHNRTRLRVFTHRSLNARPNAVFEDPSDDIAPDNETLEFVGDSVLNLTVATLITTRYPGLRVGPLAKMRALVVQNATIAQISEYYSLAQHLRANSSQLFNLRFSPAVQADLFEAYIGGLYTDWGYEHIRPWLFRVLTPWVDEAYRTIQKEYIDPSPPKQIRSPPANRDKDAFGSKMTASPGKPDIPSGSPGMGAMNRFPTIKRVSEPVLQVNAMHYASSLPISPFQKGIRSPLTDTPLSESSTLVHDTPTLQHPYLPSSVAEGHLPLLNQVLQHAKRWIDWEYVPDPKAPASTPIWDACGKMQNVVICTGRGNTKKLAKNDAARGLVTILQERAGPRCVTADLARELVEFYQEKCAANGMEGPTTPKTYARGTSPDEMILPGVSKMTLGYDSYDGSAKRAAKEVLYSSPSLPTRHTQSLYQPKYD